MVFTLLYPKGRLMAISTVVVLSLLLLVRQEKSNKDGLRSLNLYKKKKKRPKLAFCRPVPFCGAAEVLGEGSGLAV